MQGSDAIYIGGGRQPRPFEHGSALLSVIALSLSHAQGRADSGQGGRSAMDRFRAFDNPRRIDTLRTVRGVRHDAGGGLHLARDLEFTYAEVLREEYPIPNGLTLFPIDNTVPVGARTYRQKRLYSEGEAIVYRGGPEIPRVGVSAKDEVRPVRHYATSWATDVFERQSSDFAGTQLEAELMRTARDVMTEHLNHVTWHGDDANDIWGVFNYPWLDKVVSGVPLTASSTPAEILAELSRLANHAKNNSSSVFEPDTIALAVPLYTYLSSTPFGTVNDTTILEFFRKANPHIKNIVQAWELNGAGPGGADGALFYRRDRHGIANVVPQAFTTLPAQAFNFESITYAYMSHGGLRMASVGNNLLVWFQT